MSSFSPSSSSTTRSKKKDSLQELRAGTVQRLSQHFLQASQSQPPPPPPPPPHQAVHKPASSPARYWYQPMVIPTPFRPDGPGSSISSAMSLTEKQSPSSTSPQSTFISRRDLISTTSTPKMTPHHARQQSAPQLFLRPASPAITSSPTLPLSNPPSQLASSVGLVQSKNIVGGLSASSMGSEDSFASALSYFDSPREPGSPRMGMIPLWKQMLTAIDAEDRQELNRVLHAFDFAIVIQTLVTWNTPNTDNQYKHDPDVLLDAKELLGPKVDHLNLIQIACFLFNEEMALDMLNFVAKASEELESKKILYEFMGKMWGDGNTTLHLASFLGMADLTKRLLDLGANVYKMNHRKYKPVDCADENTTMSLFLNLTEVVRYKRIGQESLPTSPTTDSGSNFHWSSFKLMGHMRSTSTSTIPLSKLASSDIHFSTGPSSGYSILRPASTLGIASKLQGLLISDPGNNSNSDTSQGLSPKLEPASNACGSLQGDGLIEDLQLTESSQPRELEVDGQRQTILSPIVVSKFSEPNSNASRTSSSLHSGTNSATGSLTKGEATFATSLSTFNALHPSDMTRQLDCNLSTTASSSSSSSSASYIRPKLRSYQSSPSIRLYASTTSLTTKESRAGALPKRNKGGKRVSFDPQSMMADASKTGDLELYKSMLTLMLQENPSKALVEVINHQSVSRNLSSLHLAASYNHIALCRFLVQSGANVNLTDLEGWTPMHCAAAEGHLEVFEFLVKEKQADLQAATYDGEFFEDLVEDEDLRQRVTAILEAQSR
ncbi:MAG: hypothetical protein J3R72DRAFT_145823 [Linnemannia gamsii]|nr:MAG: hypothetical protein J3R72DRAFT_145823 [Linnemannia gamsii]